MSCVCLLFVCVVFGFVFGVVVAFVSLCLVFGLFFDERDSTLDYVPVLYQFAFAATTASAFA